MNDEARVVEAILDFIEEVDAAASDSSEGVIGDNKYRSFLLGCVAELARQTNCGKQVVMTDKGNGMCDIHIVSVDKETN